uniref:Protein kinase domain-containing protein n=1 Tax=Panagrolaimus sp. ES5 TaxID=591445 RepID=A0AC34GVY3_9BILA
MAKTLAMIRVKNVINVTSATYYDAVFECSENCESLSKEIHGKDYFYCTPSKTSNKLSQTSDLQKQNYAINASTNVLNIDQTSILIILVAVLICILVCFGGIALTCYFCYLFKDKLYSIPPTRTPDIERNGAEIKVARNEPLIIPQAQHRFNNAVVYNNLEILNTDNYILGEVIGGGSYSRVYEGELDGKQVAIKMALREGRKSIHKELQIYDKVSHPNILPALGVHLAVENLLFMPLRKFNLTDYFIDYGTIIQIDKLLRYCIQISSAVKYLHEKDILHCDLKIDNILVKDEDGEEVEISDFGCGIDLAHDREARYNVRLLL